MLPSPAGEHPRVISSRRLGRRDVRGSAALLRRQPRADGSVHVHLDAGHPGFGDPAYRAAATRSPRSRAGLGARAARAAGRLHRRRARGLAPGLRRARASSTSATPAAPTARRPPRSRCPADRVPQLEEVSAALRPLTGFAYVPAAGIVPLQEFYGALGDGVVPLHAVHPPPARAALHARARPHPRGHRARQPARGPGLRASSTAWPAWPPSGCETAEALQFLADVFWFTIEFGVLWEDGELRAYGAGILSSYGEIEEFRHMEIRPFDVARDGHAALRHHRLPADPVRAPRRWARWWTS